MTKVDYRSGKKDLEFRPYQGEKLDTCATISHDYVCCNVKVLKSVSNCPFDCSYCFLQNYLTDGTTYVVEDIEKMMAEIAVKMMNQPWRFFRIGTWELGDSLALENETGQATQLIQRFSSLDNVVLELKTKSDIVDPILDLDHQQRTVVSWSLNTEYVVNKQEHKTARLHERLEAMRKVQDAGYLIGLHFDPMIYYSGWEDGYRHLIDEIFAFLKPENVAWISFGSLRFNPEMKKKMEENFPAGDLTYAEMVLGPDGKMRYVKPNRIQMYQTFYGYLQEAIGVKDLSPTTEFMSKKPIVYLCMERADMWDKVMGDHPANVGDLDYLFAKGMRDRFPQLNVDSPDRELYIKHQAS